MKPFLFLCGNNRSVSTLTLHASVLAGVLALTGCAGIGTIPDTSLPGSSVQPGAIQGSVFGGHAPIVGAHVYVLQAGTGGYATASTSLLTTGTGTDDNGTYVVTDNYGAFNITGDYACTSGHPVYLASIGGSSSATPTDSITSDTFSEEGNSGRYTVTFNAANTLTVGQTVTFIGLTGGYSQLNGTTQNVAAPLSSSSFTIKFTGGRGSLSGSTTGYVVYGANPAIAGLATLGDCPSSGNFSTAGNGAIANVFMNEVSTVATAVAFSGFGSGPFNIAAPTTNLVGIQNAANNAAQLYSIQGTYLSTTADGEGHIANPTTPAGNGIVPQATLDTLGNILASCIDSNNTANSASDPTAAGASINCSTLFTYATSNGIPYGSTGVGTIPTDTATAAFNIAHNPAGNRSHSTSFMTAIFALQGSEITPFTPDLSTIPNDFTIGIQYTAALNPGGGGTPSILKGPDAVAVDGNGNYWFTTEPSGPPPPGTASNGYIAESSPLGVTLHDSYNASFVYGDIAIDSSNNAWTGNQGAYVDATEDGPTTSYTPTARGSAFTFAEAAVADNSATSGAVFFPHGPTDPPTTPGGTDNNQTLTEITASGGTSGTIGNMTGSFNPGAYGTHGAVDAAGYIWFTSNTPTYGNTITRVAKGTGTAATGFPINASAATTGCPTATASTILNPEQPAIDAAGNAWVPVLNGGAGSTVIKVTSNGTCTAFTVGAGPYGATIDGSDNLWVTNNAGNSITELSAPTGTAISPTTNYTIGGMLSGPQGLSVDLSGDLIVTNYTGNSIVEVIGVATPTSLPLGVAAGNSKLGAKP
jgi:hypothetical protein